MISRAIHALLVALLVAGCSENTVEQRPAPVVVPSVTTATVLADAPEPPAVVLLDATGALSVATIATWDELATKDVRAGARTGRAEELVRAIRARAAPAQSPLLARSVATRGPLGGQAARPRGDGMASRVASVGGEVIRAGGLEPLYAILVAAPSTNATLVIDAVTRLDSAIAVAHGGKIRPLRIQFVVNPAPATEEAAGWIEARVSPAGVAIEGVPDVPIELATLEPDALREAIAKVRKARGLADSAPVDVLVTPEVDAQRLVDVLVALDLAGVRMLGMGAVATGEEANRRGRRVANLGLAQPSVHGDLDPAHVSAVFERHRDELLECYEAGLLRSPNLAGEIHVRFFITPSGAVTTVGSTGLDEGVSNCVNKLIDAMEFPKPVGGGGAQVSYRLTFRS